jgi:tripeptidyl-peptidase-1
MIFHRLSLIALTFVTAVTAGPIATSYVVHEKRDGVPGGWTRGGKVNPHMSLPLRIALKQNNLHLGHDHLMDVSDPRSENYGQHWSATRVAEYFAPSEDSVDAVKQWLVSSGIDAGRLSRSFSLGWIELDASASEIESLLHTDLSVYLHENGQAHVACIEYSVPESIREHIDFITPTVHFDVKPNSGGKKQRDIARRSTSSTIAARESGKLVPHSMARLDKGHKNRSPNPDNFDPFGVAHCDLNITLSCLRALYEIPVSTRANPKNSFGITEYSNFYLPADMDMFFKLFEPDLVGHRPVLNSVDGGEDETQFVSFGDNGESDLDLQYAMSLVYPQEIQLFQNGDIVEGASFNNFLDAIDASYCTFEGGDDPTQDGVYPDPSNMTGAFKGPQACGTYEPTWVISTSYGMNEVDATPFYLQR